MPGSRRSPRLPIIPRTRQRKSGNASPTSMFFSPAARNHARRRRKNVLQSAERLRAFPKGKRARKRRHGRAFPAEKKAPFSWKACKTQGLKPMGRSAGASNPGRQGRSGFPFHSAPFPAGMKGGSASPAGQTSNFNLFFKVTVSAGRLLTWQLPGPCALLLRVPTPETLLSPVPGKKFLFFRKNNAPFFPLFPFAVQEENEGHYFVVWPFSKSQDRPFTGRFDLTL